MEIEALISPISAETPCGVNLEYDPDFLSLDLAARGKPEQQFGNTIVPGEEPDWRNIKLQAEALLTRTKDLRIAVLLLRALAHTENFVGVAAGLKLINQLLLLYWDFVHPMLDADDSHDPTMRLNALMPLGDSDAFVRDLRMVYLVAPGRNGKISVKDILILTGKFPALGENSRGQSEIDSILRANATNTESSGQIDAARDALASCRMLQLLLIEKVGVERMPNIKVISDILSEVVKCHDNAIPRGDSFENDAVATDAAGSDNAPAITGMLRTREDALLQLDRVCEFIEHTEPGHPAPLLIRRAKRLMGMSFVEILQDLTPDGLSQARNIFGLDKK